LEAVVIAFSTLILMQIELIVLQLLGRHFWDLNEERLVLDLYDGLEFENILEQEVHQTDRGLRLDLLVLLVDLVVLLLIPNVDSGLSVFVLLAFPDYVELIGFVGRRSRHSPLVLLLRQRDVQEIEEPQIYLIVDFKLTVILQNVQVAELSVENEVLVRLDQNIGDGHDAVLQGFLLKLVEELWGGNLLTRCFDGDIGHVAILSPHVTEAGDPLSPFLGVLQVLFVII